MNSVHLHQKLVKQLQAIGLQIGKSRRENLALWCQALAVSPNCHLATLALGLPLTGQRENLIQRLRRFLKDQQLSPQACYRPVVGHLFRHWSGREVSLVMDRTDIENRWSILSLGAAYRKRLLPLTWQVFSFGGTSAKAQINLLRQVQPLLPSGEQVRVHFYGDSEFRAVPLQQTCQRYGWHWQVGLKSDLYFHQGEGHWRSLQSLQLQPGQRRYLNQVYLTQKHSFGPLNLIADWSLNQPQPRYWALDLPADAQAWRRGRKRFWTEPTFRDWKGYGFDLERTKIDDPDRLNNLLLGIALTTVWMIHIGDWLTSHGHRYLLCPDHKTDYSLFRLGRDYVQRCRTMGWSIPISFTVSHG
jgi:hypothetical protein